MGYEPLELTHVVRSEIDIRHGRAPYQKRVSFGLNILLTNLCNGITILPSLTARWERVTSCTVN